MLGACPKPCQIPKMVRHIENLGIVRTCLVQAFLLSVLCTL